MFTDSHAHLDDPCFNDDRAGVIQRAWDAGVQKILTIGNGAGPDQMGCGVPIAEAHDWIFASVGIHPHDASKTEERHYRLIEELSRHPRVLAIGETGLDYYYDNSPRDIQRQVFQRQLALAKTLDLPVIVHSRDADDDTIMLLKAANPLRGVIHCFTSGEKLADVALDLGFYISFSGIVTFPKAQELASIARRVPIDRLLIETDCPYLAPVPHRGKRNEPAFVVATTRFLADLLEIPFEQLGAQTSTNFDSLFAVKSS